MMLIRWFPLFLTLLVSAPARSDDATVAALGRRITAIEAAAPEEATKAASELLSWVLGSAVKPELGRAGLLLLIDHYPTLSPKFGSKAVLSSFFTVLRELYRQLPEADHAAIRSRVEVAMDAPGRLGFYAYDSGIDFYAAQDVISLAGEVKARLHGWAKRYKFYGSKYCLRNVGAALAQPGSPFAQAVQSVLALPAAAAVDQTADPEPSTRANSSAPVRTAASGQSARSRPGQPLREPDPYDDLQEAVRQGQASPQALDLARQLAIWDSNRFKPFLAYLEIDPDPRLKQRLDLFTRVFEHYKTQVTVPMMVAHFDHNRFFHLLYSDTSFRKDVEAYVRELAQDPDALSFAMYTDNLLKTMFEVVPLSKILAPDSLAYRKTMVYFLAAADGLEQNVRWFTVWETQFRDAVRNRLFDTDARQFLIDKHVGHYEAFLAGDSREAISGRVAYTRWQRMFRESWSIALLGGQPVNVDDPASFDFNFATCGDLVGKQDPVKAFLFEQSHRGLKIFGMN